MDGENLDIYHNGATNAPKGKKAVQNTASGESTSMTTAVASKKMKKKDMARKIKEFDAMANELEAEKLRSDELRRELERIRMQKEPLEDAGSSAPATDIENQSVSDYSANFRPHSTRKDKSSLEESRFMSSINQLSISSVNIPECMPTGEEGEIHRHAFEQWKDLLEDSLKLAGISDEATQFMIFKVKAGRRLLDIYKNAKSDENAPDFGSTPFSNAMYRLKNFFGSGSDTMFQRRKLSLMFQKSSESDSAYITRVGTTARLCEFGEDRESEAILGTVADHARTKEVRTAALKILHRKGSFTDLIDKVREIECIRLSEQFFKERQEPKEPASIAPVSADFPHHAQQYRRQNFNASVLRQRGLTRGYPMRQTSRRRVSNNIRTPFVHQGNQRAQGTRCWRCTSVFHDAAMCHAISKICRSCGRKGHIQIACESTYHTGTKRESEYDTATSEAPPRKIAAIQKEDCDDVPVEKVSDENEN
ncbi:uncharacterized protein LOC134215005 [Armigeres subalbatus]|uniref:uncharacterized protein LOC134215005 n=1 Tax=Armigeres subalbatus TaxID=124917 RepID=UPI002ECFE00E